MVAAMRKHLSFMRSRGVEPDARMCSFVFSVCAQEASTPAAFAAIEILQEVQVCAEP